MNRADFFQSSGIHGLTCLPLSSMSRGVTVVGFHNVIDLLDEAEDLMQSDLTVTASSVSPICASQENVLTALEACYNEVLTHGKSRPRTALCDNLNPVAPSVLTYQTNLSKNEIQYQQSETVDLSSIEPTPIGPASSINVVQEYPFSQVDSLMNAVERMPWHYNFDDLASSLRTSTKNKRPCEDEDLPVLREKKIKCEEVSDKNFVSASGDDIVLIRNYQSERWSERFKELIQFCEKHGNCLVPHDWKENPALAQWVKRHRYQYKLKKLGKRSTLTQERQHALERLGFVWDSHKAIWEERLGELREFQQFHFHCNVPTIFPDNPPLSIWVKCQRRQYKLFLRNKGSNLTEERISKLNQLGFIWNPRKLKTVPEV